MLGLPLTLLLLQLIHQRVNALSSSSPPDLFAFPAYKVVLNREMLSNDTATELLQSQDESTRYELMRTKGGIGFLCSIPVETKTSQVALQQVATEITVQEPPIQETMNATAGLEKGLALLEPLKGGCLYQKQGWFTCKPSMQSSGVSSS
jgi:hypothetical protein